MNYYNFGTEKCEKCVEHCKECLNGIGCEVCKGGFYKSFICLLLLFWNLFFKMRKDYVKKVPSVNQMNI